MILFFYGIHTLKVVHGLKGFYHTISGHIGRHQLLNSASVTETNIGNSILTTGVFLKYLHNCPLCEAELCLGVIVGSHSIV